MLIVRERVRDTQTSVFPSNVWLQIAYEYKYKCDRHRMVDLCFMLAPPAVVVVIVVVVTANIESWSVVCGDCVWWLCVCVFGIRGTWHASELTACLLSARLLVLWVSGQTKWWRSEVRDRFRIENMIEPDESTRSKQSVGHAVFESQRWFKYDLTVNTPQFSTTHAVQWFYDSECTTQVMLNAQRVIS